MSESARILQFPAHRQIAAVTEVEAEETASLYLSTQPDARDKSLLEATVSHPEVLLAICGRLRDLWETSPSTAAQEAKEVYRLIESCDRSVGLFDERSYFLGEAALIAATAYRLIGQLEEGGRWLDRAESAFRHTINPAPSLANLAYARLALRFMLAQFDDVLELLPSLIKSFKQLGMELEAEKCRFLAAKTLLQLGRTEECLHVVGSLSESAAVRRDPVLLGHVLTHLGNCYSLVGRFEEASAAYEQALPVVQQKGVSATLAGLKWSIGDTCRAQNRLGRAVEAYRAAQADYSALSMTTSVSQLHLAIAENLLSLGRSREAEWEILAALPTIEEQKMVPEGFAAVALLKESVRRRKTDPNALRELREHLQANR